MEYVRGGRAIFHSAYGLIGRDIVKSGSMLGRFCTGIGRRDNKGRIKALHTRDGGAEVGHNESGRDEKFVRNDEQKGGRPNSGKIRYRSVKVLQALSGIPRNSQVQGSQKGKFSGREPDSSPGKKRFGKQQATQNSTTPKHESMNGNEGIVKHVQYHVDANKLCAPNSSNMSELPLRDVGSWERPSDINGIN